MDGGVWWAAVHGVAKSRTRLSDFTFTFHLHALEKEMATHSSVLAWRIPGTGEPGRPPSMGSRRVRRDWSDLAAHIYRYPPLLRKVYFLPLHFYKRPTWLVPVFTNSKKFKDFSLLWKEVKREFSICLQQAITEAQQTANSKSSATKLLPQQLLSPSQPCVTTVVILVFKVTSQTREIHLLWLLSLHWHIITHSPLTTLGFIPDAKYSMGFDKFSLSTAF